jgi:hypothetical protein
VAMGESWHSCWFQRFHVRDPVSSNRKYI